MRGQLRNLVRHSSVYALGNLLSKALFVLLVPLYARLLTKDDYGSLMLINGGLAVLSVSYEMGATSALMRLYYDFEGEEERRRYVGSVWAFVLLTTLAITIALTAVGPWLVKPLYRGVPYWPYLVGMIWIAWLGTANDVPATLFRIKEQSLRFVSFVLAQTATLLLATIFFVAVLHKGLGGALAGVLVANAVFFVIYSVVTLRNVTPTLSWFNAKRTLAYGLPVVALHAGWWVLDASDRFILRYFTTLDVVAVYGIGYVVGKALQMITTSINQAWTPFFFRIVQEGDPEAKRLFAYTATGFAVVLSFLGLAIAVFAREAVLAVGGYRYVDAIGITPVIALASVCYGMFFVPSRGLYLRKQTKLFPVIIGLASAVNIGLNFILIPPYGMAGAAWATVAGYISAVALTFVLSQRYYPIAYEWRRLLQVFAIALALGVAAQFVMTDSVLHLGLRVLLLLALPVLLLATGFFTADERSAARQLAAAAGRRLRGSHA